MTALGVLSAMHSWQEKRGLTIHWLRALPAMVASGEDCFTRLVNESEATVIEGMAIKAELGWLKNVTFVPS